MILIASFCAGYIVGAVLAAWLASNVIKPMWEKYMEEERKNG